MRLKDLISLLKRPICIIICFYAATLTQAADNTISSIINTEDGIPISYEQRKTGSDSVIIICPGFYNSKSSRWMKETAKIISSRFDSIIFDFRGHGMSGGKYTWSAKEHMDLEAVIEYAKSQKYKHIGILAFSLGAASAIEACALKEDDIESMVLISCPTSFRMIDFHFWEPGMFSDLADNIECRWEGKGANFTNIFIPKRDPIDLIDDIETPSILFIHGSRDWIIKDRHSRKLYNRAMCHKDLKVIENGLHAERLIQKNPEMMADIILDWFSKTFNDYKEAK